MTQIPSASATSESAPREGEGPWDAGFVDLDGDQGLLGQVEGRPSKAVTDWLTAQSTLFRDQITHVVIDPSDAYAAAVPNPQMVVDHSHLVTLANDVVTAVRRRVTFDARGRRGRTHDPEWRTAACSMLENDCRTDHVRRCGMR